MKRLLVSTLLAIAPAAAQPSISTTDGVVNGATFQGPIASNTWLTIRGTNLAPTTRTWAAGDFNGNALPTSLDGVQVRINGRLAYPYFVSPGQINVLAPDDPATGPVAVQVIAPGGSSNSVTVTKASASPGLFAYSAQGGRYVIAQNAATYALLGPAGLLGAGVELRAARPGEDIVLYATGLGLTSPAYPAAETIPAPAPLVPAPQVLIGGTLARVTFAGITSSGLYQINAVVPEVPTGNALLEVRVGTARSQANAFLPVQGSTPAAAPSSYIISRFAGNGSIRGSSGDGGPAIEAAILPAELAFDRTGSLHFVGGRSVRKIAPDGIVTTVAGSDAGGAPGDGGPATEARFQTTSGLAFDAVGNLYVSDSFANVIRRISPTGTITRFAGTGEDRHGGDGGPALQAQIPFPRAMDVDHTGNLLVTTSMGLRKIAPNGVISSVNTVPAVTAGITNGVAVDPANNVIYYNRRYLRKVSPSGEETIIGGSGAPGFSGDGGPARLAAIGNPGGIAVDAQGNIYIVDTDAFRIRRIDTSGTIVTIAGTGVNRSSGDGGPASQASIGIAQGIAVDGQGRVFFSETFNGVIRVLTPVR